MSHPGRPMPLPAARGVSRWPKRRLSLRTGKDHAHVSRWHFSRMNRHARLTVRVNWEGRLLKAPKPGMRKRTGDGPSLPEGKPSTEQGMHSSGAAEPPALPAPPCSRYDRLRGHGSRSRATDSTSLLGFRSPSLAAASRPPLPGSCVTMTPRAARRGGATRRLWRRVPQVWPLCLRPRL